MKVKEKTSTSEGFGRVRKGLEKGKGGGGELRSWFALQVDWEVGNDVWRLDWERDGCEVFIKGGLGVGTVNRKGQEVLAIVAKVCHS